MSADSEPSKPNFWTTAIIKATIVAVLFAVLGYLFAQFVASFLTSSSSTRLTTESSTVPMEATSNNFHEIAEMFKFRVPIFLGLSGFILMLLAELANVYLEKNRKPGSPSSTGTSPTAPPGGAA